MEEYKLSGCHDVHGHHHRHHHGHHHEHNEGTTISAPGFEILETHSHEGATVCSFEKYIDAEADIAPENAGLLDGKLNALTGWLEAENAVIGHIKGYVEAPEENVTFSTTGRGINYARHRADVKKLAFAAIVMGVSEEKLKEKIVELFGVI